MEKYEVELFDNALAYIYQAHMTEEDVLSIFLLMVLFVLVVIGIARGIWIKSGPMVVMGLAALSVFGLIINPAMYSTIKEHRYKQYLNRVKADQEALDKITELYLALEAGDTRKATEVRAWFKDPRNRRDKNE